METIEKKYYTPTLDEFHQGFEYEYLINDNWEKRICDTAVCDRNGFVLDIPSSDEFKYEPKEIRVPYLSKEDIEECGWEYNPVSSEKLAHNNHQMRGIYSSDMKDIRGNNFSLFHNIAENWILIWVSSSEHTHTLWDDKLTTMGETVFAGTIKNKSQLKELMKWLNIKK